MIPVRLTLRNFLSYGEAVPPLDFTPLHVVCLSGDNGHGKSALLDAMTWAIWGEARKAAGSRKPDDDLLRKGASDMAVEFELDLEGDRYRILRQYRSGRGGKSALEFQIFSPESEGFHSLTQPSMTATQQRIIATLGMDYTTFINSVFILQGRADEFTRRSARERKEILADILGLWRYDELEKRARRRADLAKKDVEEREKRLFQITEALKEKEACHQAIGLLTDRLKEFSLQMQTIEEKSTVLQNRQATLRTLTEQLSEAQIRKTSLQKRRTEAETQITRIRSQVIQHEAILAERDAIEKAVLAFHELTAEQERLTQNVQMLRQLESQKNLLERAIDKARHELEISRRELGSSQKAIEEVIAETDTLLMQRERIEKGFQDLLLAQRADEQWDEKRRLYDDLDRQIRLLRDTLLKAESALQSELLSQKRHLKDLQARVATIENSRNTVSACRQQLDQLQQLDQKKEKIADRGRELNAHVEALRTKIKLYEHENEDANTRLKVLHRGTKANCPLCDAALDDHRRETIETNIGDLLRQHAVELQKFHRGIKLSEDEKKQLAVEYKQLRPQLDALPEAVQAMATAETTLLHAVEAANEAQVLQREVSTLQERIEKRQFEEECHRTLGDLEVKQTGLGYDPNRHQTLKSRLRELQRFELEKTRLVEAQNRRAGAVEAFEAIQQKQAEIEERLAQRTYAVEAQEHLRLIELDITALGYDETRNLQVKQGLMALKNAIADKEQLDQAVRQWDVEQVELTRQVASEQALKAEYEELTARIDTLEREAGGKDELERQLEVLRDQQQALQQETNQTNQALGAEKEKARRLDEFEREKPSVEKSRQQAARDQQVYDKLAQAFSKDGIPALIIENSIPEIEEEANRILSRLTDNRTQISIEPLRNLKTGGTKETLDIHISDEMGTRPYELFSGGEAFRTNFALRIALSRLLAHRAGTRLRTLIIDEGFGTQDAQGIEHLIDALQSIQNDFEKVIVVTHLERLKNAFPARIEVTKYADIGSRYEVFV